MPHVTKEEDFSGFVGFVVVLACRKVKTPVILVANPTTTRMMANKLYAGNAKSSDGAARCTSQMNTPITNATTGGGTFNSRLRTTADHYPALLPYQRRESLHFKPILFIRNILLRVDVDTVRISQILHHTQSRPDKAASPTQRE